MAAPPAGVIVAGPVPPWNAANIALLTPADINAMTVADLQDPTLDAATAALISQANAQAIQASPNYGAAVPGLQPGVDAALTAIAGGPLPGIPVGGPPPPPAPVGFLAANGGAWTIPLAQNLTAADAATIIDNDLTDPSMNDGIAAELSDQLINLAPAVAANFPLAIASKLNEATSIALKASPIFASFPGPIQVAIVTNILSLMIDNIGANAEFITIIMTDIQGYAADTHNLWTVVIPILNDIQGYDDPSSLAPVLALAQQAKASADAVKASEDLQPQLVAKIASSQGRAVTHNAQATAALDALTPANIDATIDDITNHQNQSFVLRHPANPDSPENLRRESGTALTNAYNAVFALFQQVSEMWKVITDTYTPQLPTLLGVITDATIASQNIVVRFSTVPAGVAPENQKITNAIAQVAPLAAAFAGEARIVADMETRFAVGGVHQVAYVVPGLRVTGKKLVIDAAAPDITNSRVAFDKIETKPPSPGTIMYVIAQSKAITEQALAALVTLYVNTYLPDVKTMADNVNAAMTAIKTNADYSEQAMKGLREAVVSSANSYKSLVAAGSPPASIQQAQRVMDEVATIEGKVTTDIANLRTAVGQANVGSRQIQKFADAIRDSIAPSGVIHTALNSPGLPLSNSLQAGGSLNDALDDFARRLRDIQVPEKFIGDRSKTINDLTVLIRDNVNEARKIAGLVDLPVLKAMGHPVDITVPIQGGFKTRLENELRQVRDVLGRPTPVDVNSLPLDLLAVLAQLSLAGKGAPTGLSPDDETLVKQAGQVGRSTTEIVQELNKTPLPPADWNALLPMIAVAARKHKDEILSRVGVITKPVRVSLPKTKNCPAGSATLTPPLRVPTISAPVSQSNQQVLVNALKENKASISRLDLEILNLMVAGFLQSGGGTLQPDEASYAVKVATVTASCMNYSIESRTVRSILYQRLHPEGQSVWNLDHYRTTEVELPAAPPIERYASFKLQSQPHALPPKFGEVLRSPELTQELVSAYETYQSDRTANSYNTLVDLWHHHMGYSIAA